MHSTIGAVLDEHIIYRSILWCLVCPGALTALDGDGIIVYAHVAAIYQHIVTNINVDGIAAWCPHATGWGEDGAAKEADMVATVDVVGPERTVLNMHILQGYVAGVADIDEARTLCILIGALAVPGATNPELLPVMITVSIDGTRTGNGESVAFLGIDECEKYLQVSPSMRVSITGSWRCGRCLSVFRLLPDRDGSLA